MSLSLQVNLKTAPHRSFEKVEFFNHLEMNDINSSSNILWLFILVQRISHGLRNDFSLCGIKIVNLFPGSACPEYQFARLQNLQILYSAKHRIPLM